MNRVLRVSGTLLLLGELGQQTSLPADARPLSARLSFEWYLARCQVLLELRPEAGQEALCSGQCEECSRSQQVGVDLLS